VILGAAPAASARPDPDPKKMVLQGRDLPQEFGAVLGRYVTNSQLAATTHTKNLAVLGRVSGYYAAYTAIAVGGLTVVESFASLYEHDSGARQSLELSVAEETVNGGELVVPAARALAPLGPDARLLYTKLAQNGTKFDYYIVAWRDDRVFAEVRGAGRAGTIAPDDVIRLAKMQDAHIAKSID